MSKEDSKKPPGNVRQPQLLNEHVPQPCPHAMIDWQFSHVRKGYDLLESIIIEQQRNLIVALASNVHRHGFRDRIPDFTAAGTVIVTGVGMGHPILGAAIGAVFALGRSVWDTFRVRRNNHMSDNQAVVEVRKFLLFVAARLSEGATEVRIGKIPHVAEFQNLWVRHSWRLVHYLKGYNTRVLACIQTYEAFDRTPAQEAAAEEILRLASWFRPRLIHAFHLLEDLYLDGKGTTRGKLSAMERFNDRLDEQDPFKDRDPSEPSLEWLPLPHDSLIRAELPLQAEKDRMAIDSDKEVHVQEIDKRFDPYKDEIDALRRRHQREEAEQEAAEARKFQEEKRARFVDLHGKEAEKTVEELEDELASESEPELEPTHVPEPDADA